MKNTHRIKGCRIFISILFIFSVLSVILLSSCSPMELETDQHHIPWVCGVGTGPWWAKNTTGPSISSFEFYDDSIIAYDYWYAPQDMFKWVEAEDGTMYQRGFEKYEVTRISKYKAEVIWKDRQYIDDDNLDVLVSKTKWKLLWGEAPVYDWATYMYWGFYDIKVDSAYFGHINDDETEFFWYRFGKEMPIPIIF